MSSRRKEAEAIHAEDCWKAIERAAASAQLKRAARAREFLFYVATRSLKEGCSEIHEQEIGHAVFGRDENYETSLDNIVRVSATDLRKRIEAYFAAEGAEEPLVFEIPRGSYAPVFRWRAKEVVEEPAPVAAAAPVLPAGQPYYRQLPFLIACGAALLLAAACLWLWSQNRILTRPQNRLDGRPALSALWTRFFNSPRQTDMVLADTSFGLLENVTHQSFTLSDYINYSYLTKLQSSGLSADRKQDLSMIMERSHGSVGDFKAVQRIWALNPFSSRLNFEYAREYSADSVKRDNVVLIGGQVSNPWEELFYNQMAFTIEYDPASDRSYVRNARPAAGEQALYPVLLRSDGVLGYAVAAYLPNPSHTADALIIAGTDSQATDAAAEFLTSEASLEKLFRKFPPGHLPYFEVLLKVARLSGTPLTEEILTYRTY